jgi:hypothetical protein
LPSDCPSFKAWINAAESESKYLASKPMKFDSSIGHQIFRDLEGTSRQVFGKKYRLPIAAVALALDPPIWARQLARALEIGENQAASELAELERMGAVHRVQASYDRRKVFQQRDEDPFWDFARQKIEDVVRARDPDGVGSFWDAMAEAADPQRFLERGG